MRSEVARRLVAVSLLVSAAASQAPTVPALLAGVEGGGGTSIPFGSSLGCRYQCVYDAVELPWVGPRVISGIRLRADNNTPNTSIAAKTITVSVLMSTTRRSAADVSPIFAENHGTDATWVIQNQVVTLPAQPALPAGPRPAEMAFVFAVPWAYGLTPAITSLPPPANLLVEILIHSQGNGVYRVDNINACSSPQSSFGLAGPACAVPGSSPVALSGDPSMLAGESFTWRVANAPPSAPFVVALNPEHAVGLFGNPGWPLPYPMFDPGNPSLPSPALAALNGSAPDCWFNIDPLILLIGISDSSGSGAVSALLPAGRQTVGSPLHAQAIALAPGVNTLQLLASPGLTAAVCGPLAVARVHVFFDDGIVPPPPPPTAGSVQPGVGLVFEVM